MSVDTMQQVRDACSKAAAQHPDIEKAIKAAKASLHSVWPRFVEECADHALRQMVRAAIHNSREDMRNAGLALARDGQLAAQSDSMARARYASRVAEMGIMETWYIGDKRLGDCTGTELKAEAERERSTAKGHLRNADAYAKIAAIAKDRKVRDACTEKDVQKAFRSADI